MIARLTWTAKSTRWALQARLALGDPNGIPQHILDKRIEYLADYAGMADWIKLPLLGPHFALIVEDSGRAK